MKWMMIAVTSLAFAPSCIHVAESRAQADLTVGQADTDAMRIAVKDGLACIRASSAELVDVRAQAPVFTIALKRKTASRTLDVRIRNALPDATLSVVEVGGARPGASLGVIDEPRVADVTDRRFRVPIPDGTSSELELRVGAPDQDDLRPYRFAVLADVQEAIPSVRDIYTRMNQDQDIRFVVFSGDLTRRGSQEELEEFEDRERELRVPLYATLGNHELGADEVYFQKMFGRGNFHFQFRGVAFTLLDSGSATIDPLAYDWLEGWLEGSKERVHVVAMHIPPLDPVGVRSGAFASRSEAAKLLSMLAKGKVDLSLYGHVHSYYAFSNAGVPAYISGGGGAIPERLDGIGRHYLVVDVDPKVGVRSVGLTRVD